MATQIKRRRGNSSEIGAFTPAVGEWVHNTDDHSIHSGDGATQGGYKHVNEKNLADMSGFTFASVQDMQTGTLANGLTITFKVGDLISTGLGRWRVNSKTGLALPGGLKAKPLNGVYIDDCGAKGNALFRDDSTGLWYVDSGFTTLSDNDTTAFSLAMTATGGTDAKGTINFGEGGYLITPETIDAAGIDIRQKTLNGLSPFVTTVVQSGQNTYQTFFRNGPVNLAGAGTWGSGGTFNIQHMYIRGNWDGASDQTFIPPVSGNGNGITGILKAEYDFDAQGGVIQLISATRASIRDVWVSHGYGHNMKYYRHGYGEITSGRSFATRGSGCWIKCPSASDSFTSTPITNMRFETCRGEYGGINILHMWGSSINNNLFEGQPYGIYMGESGDVDTSGNYQEGHYFEDFFTAAEVWGIVDIGSYAFGQKDPRDVTERKGFMHYRRDSGLHVQTDTSSFGIRPADINGFYMQRDSLGHGIMPSPLTGTGGVYQQLVKQLSGGGASLEYYTSVKHTHNDADDSGAAEVRFQRNLSQNSWGALSFATYDGATLADRWWVDKGGDFRPAVDNAYKVGNASFRASEIFAASATINTSDKNLKTQIEDIPQSVCDAALALKIQRFKMKGAFESKSENARWHYGVIAQDAMAVFESHGVELDQFGAICKDSFDEPVTMDGVELSEVWGVRYEELNIIIIEAIRRKLA